MKAKNDVKLLTHCVSELLISVAGQIQRGVLFFYQVRIGRREEIVLGQSISSFKERLGTGPDRDAKQHKLHFIPKELALPYLANFFYKYIYFWSLR